MRLLKTEDLVLGEINLDIAGRNSQGKIILESLRLEGWLHF
jgi:hypothetical protein